MALRDDIRVLAQRSLAALDATLEYVAHSKAVWKHFQSSVDRGIQFTVRTEIVGSVIDQRELKRRAKRYIKDRLTPAVFQESVTLFESFLFDFLALWLTEYPQSLSARTLEFRRALEAADPAE